MKRTKKKTKMTKADKHHKAINELSRAITIVMNERDSARQWGRQLNTEAYEATKERVRALEHVGTLIARIAAETARANALDKLVTEKEAQLAEQDAIMSSARNRITELLNEMAAAKNKGFLATLFGR